MHYNHCKIDVEITHIHYKLCMPVTFRVEAPDEYIHFGVILSQVSQLQKICIFAHSYPISLTKIYFETVTLIGFTS